MEEDYKLAKWLNNELSEDELVEFKKDSDYELWNKIKENSAFLSTPIFDENRILQNVLKSKKDSKVISLQNWFVKIAAVFVIGLGLYFGTQTMLTTTQLAEKGNKTNFLLPDNSEVALNSDSEMEFKKWNWENNRTLDLNGEAYFKVAKGKTFEVNTSLGKVTVLGTQFNVKARNNRFDVTCFEGKVKVKYNSQEIILTKGELISFENNRKIITKTILEAQPTWINKEVSFEKENLLNVLSEIERQYNIAFNYKNIDTNQLFTGKIPTDNIDVALQIISATYHFEIQKDLNKSYLISTKK
ncbi:FecR family protein [uncultured Flavobacterium sp.]|uniref:FecR family protein n=1 Tax=uncultured Flavobacterium sp. TaxID=165435 RepID=UPI0030C8B60E